LKESKLVQEIEEIAERDHIDLLIDGALLDKESEEILKELSLEDKKQEKMLHAIN